MALPEVTTERKERMWAFVELCDIMPPVRRDEMLDFIAFVCALPKPLRMPVMRVWGFLHPLPYLLKAPPAGDRDNGHLHSH